MSVFNNNYKRQGKIGLFDNQEASERLSNTKHNYYIVHMPSEKT